MTIKPGVRLIGLSAEMMLGISIVAGIYEEYGVECVLTSITDGDHSKGSWHHAGRAADFRTRNIPDADTTGRIVQQCREKLGPDFDVVLHKTHLHVEYDPK